MLSVILCASIIQLIVTCALVGGAMMLRDDVRILLKKVTNMSAAFDALKADVQADKAVISSAVTLLKGIDARLANATSPEDIAALRSDLAASLQPLADAVAANTPAAPAA